MHANMFKQRRFQTTCAYKPSVHDTPGPKRHPIPFQGRWPPCTCCQNDSCKSVCFKAAPGPLAIQPSPASAQSSPPAATASSSPCELATPLAPESSSLSAAVSMSSPLAPSPLVSRSSSSSMRCCRRRLRLTQGSVLLQCLRAVCSSPVVGVSETEARLGNVYQTRLHVGAVCLPFCRLYVACHVGRWPMPPLSLVSMLPKTLRERQDNLD